MTPALAGIEKDQVMNGLQFRNLMPAYWFAMAAIMFFVLAIAFLPLVLVWLAAAPAWAWGVAGMWAGLVLLAIVLVVSAIRD